MGTGVGACGDSTRLTEPHDLLTCRRSHETRFGTAAPGASARTAANRSRTCCSGTPRVMNTSRLVRLCVRPSRELDRRVGEVLHDLHQHRAAAARDVEEALHAQKVGAAQRHQGLHGARERVEVERRLLGEDEAQDAIANARPRPRSLSARRPPGSVRQRGSSTPSTAISIGACLLSVRRCAVRSAGASGSARSALVMTIRSARIACLRASADQPSVDIAADRVDRGQHHLDEKLSRRARVGRERLQDRPRIGEPAVSISTRSKSATRRGRDPSPGGAASPAGRSG